MYNQLFRKEMHKLNKFWPEKFQPNSSSLFWFLYYLDYLIELPNWLPNFCILDYLIELGNPNNLSKIK